MVNELITAAGQDAVKIALAMKRLEELCDGAGTHSETLFVKSKQRIYLLKDSMPILKAIQTVYKEVVQWLK